MGIARTTVALVGTDETTGLTIASAATNPAVEIDLLGDDTSTGMLDLYLVATSTVTAGSIDLTFNSRRLTGQAYKARAAQWSVSPINGTLRLSLGSIRATRFVQVDVFNNATGANLTNVSVLAELWKFTWPT
jgi:hypothetical protein